MSVTPGRLLGDLPPAPPPTRAERVAYLRYVALWRAVEALPERRALALSRTLGRTWARFAPSRQREMVRRNLTRITRSAGSGASVDDATVDASFASYARYWIDAFRLHRMDGERVLREASGVGLHHIDGVRDGGAGGILATGHLGSWDVGALFSSQRRWGMVVVAEVVQPRRLFDRFVDLRVRAGLDVIPLVRGGPMLDQLEGSVQRGGLATLLADRDLTRRGPIVDFFGEPCRLPPGTAALARRTGRPVATGAFLTAGDGYHGVVLKPVDIAGLDVYDGTQVVAEQLERLIAVDATQWHVFVPNWLADREPDHPVVASWRAGEDWRALAKQAWRSSQERGA